MADEKDYAADAPTTPAYAAEEPPAEWASDKNRLEWHRRQIKLAKLRGDTAGRWKAMEALEAAEAEIEEKERRAAAPPEAPAPEQPAEGGTSPEYAPDQPYLSPPSPPNFTPASVPVVVGGPVIIAEPVKEG